MRSKVCGGNSRKDCSRTRELGARQATALTVGCEQVEDAIPDKSRRTLRTLTHPASYAWSSRDRIPQAGRTNARWTGKREERTYEEATTGRCSGRRDGGGIGWKRLHRRLGSTGVADVLSRGPFRVRGWLQL